jgi:DNA-binding response OmpR family regulator
MLLTTGPADPLFEFGPFVADPVAGRLYCGDDEVPLTPKAFKVLMLLVSSDGQLIDKGAALSPRLARHVRRAEQSRPERLDGPEGAPRARW